MNEHITEYLNYYVDMENPQYAVLLMGNWGCGKTFFIKKLMTKWEEENNLSENIIFKPIYVSLNGVSSVHTINQKIRAKINPFLYSKGMKVGKKVLAGLLKTTVKIDMNFDEDEKNDGSFSFNIDSLGLLDSSNKEINGKRILVFDDIERCKIETDEIFGYLNNFVEHSSCKVILLSDEGIIRDRYEKNKSELDVGYKDFKEKLIGQTFEVKSDIEAAIKFFIEGTKNLNRNLDLKVHNQMVVDLFESSKLENLRVLKQALLDFGRLTSLIDGKLKTHNNYLEFVKNFLAYFVIVYAELKTGSVEIKNYQDLFTSDNENELKSKNEAKYKEVLNKYKVLHSTYVFPIKELISYVECGYIESYELNKYLQNNFFFREDVEEDWEKLWYWQTLEDADFHRYKDSVWSQFAKEEIVKPSILIHVTGILLKLIDEKLLNEKSGWVLKKAKKIMKKIIHGNFELQNDMVFGYKNSSMGKQYHSDTTYEFKELLKYSNELLDNKILEHTEDYLRNIFENVDSKSWYQVHPKLNKIIPGTQNIYFRIPILKGIDGKKLGKRIKEMDNKVINDVIYFFCSRYRPEVRFSGIKLDDYHKEDRKCLEGLKNELDVGVVKHKEIKNRLLSNFVKELEIIIKKLDTL